MLTRRILIGLATIAALAGPAVAQETIKVGLTGPFTGGSAPLGVSIRDGVKLAVLQINQKGGIGGKKIELVERDDESKPERGVQLAQELINSERVAAVVGIANTPVVLAASRFYQENRVPIIIPVATGSVITKQFPAPSYIFRIGAFDTIQSAMMADEVVKRRGITKVAILADSTNYGQLGAADLIAVLQGLGVKPVLVDKFNVRDPDMTPQLLKARAAGAEAVYGYALGPDLAQIANSMAKINWKVPYVTSWNSSMSNYIDNAGANGEGVRMPQTFIQDAGVSARWATFINEYQKTYGVDRLPSPSSAAQSYDAMLLLAAAIEQAGAGANGDQIRVALESLAKPVQGVIAAYTKPFSAEDHEATKAEHVVFGEVRAGRIIFADDTDKKKVGQ